MADSIFMKAEEIMKALGVSQSEAYRIIGRLIKAGLIVMVRKGRNIFYQLSNKL